MAPAGCSYAALAPPRLDSVQHGSSQQEHASTLPGSTVAGVQRAGRAATQRRRRTRGGVGVPRRALAPCGWAVAARRCGRCRAGACPMPRPVARRPPPPGSGSEPALRLRRLCLRERRTWWGMRDGVSIMWSPSLLVLGLDILVGRHSVFLGPIHSSASTARLQPPASSTPCIQHQKFMGGSRGASWLRRR